MPETVQITQIFLTKMVRSICPANLPIYTIGEASCFCERNSGQNSNWILKNFAAVCIFAKIRILSPGADDSEISTTFIFFCTIWISHSGTYNFTK